MGAFYRQNLIHTLQTLAFAAILLVSAFPAHAQDITSDLVGHWKLDEASGTSIADDSGNAITGTAAGMGTDVVSTAGSINTAITFDGSNDRISLGTTNLLRLEDDVTFSAWINPIDPPADGVGAIYARAVGGVSGVLLMIDSAGEILLVDDDNDVAAETSTGPVQFSAGWQHIAVVKTAADNVKFYYNGAYVSQDTLDLNAASGTNAYIGRYHSDPCCGFDGDIDDVRIYSRDLSAADIAALYAYSGATPGAYTGPVTCDADYEAVMWYNDDENIMQYCNGTNWIAMDDNGAEGNNAGTCTDPDGTPGEVDYNASAGQMQYCNGANWISMGPKLGDAGIAEDITYDDPTADLIGHWKFDETTATTTALDSSDSGIDGTMTSMTGAANTITGKRDTALSFDGANDYVSIDSSILSGVTDELTFSVWLHSSIDQLSWSPLFQQQSEVVEFNETFGILAEASGNDELIAAIYVANEGSVSVYSGVQRGDYQFAWTHVAGVYDGSHLKIYVNGEFKNQEVATGNIVLNANDITIGAGTNNDAFNEYFAGGIDDVRIYDAALTDEEISDLYLATSRGGLVSHWKLDETGGTTTATDETGSHNGTMTSMTGTANTTTGSSGTALTFDGTADYINIGDPADGSLDFGSSQNFTLSAWVKYINDGFIISKYIGGVTTGYWLGSSGGFAEIAIKDAIGAGTSETVQVAGSISIDDGNWHMLTATYDRDGNGKLYVDGILDVTTNISTITDNINNTAAVRIGARDNNGSLGAFEGDIDDARIYSRLLSAEEIADLYLNTGGASLAADCSGLGDAQYTDPSTGNCYFREDSTANWADAQTDCNANGGYLAAISSEAENTAIYTNLSIASEHYIGASDIDSEGDWRWKGGELENVQFWSGTSGGSVVGGLYNKWAGAEPNNNAGTQHCSSIGFTGAEWNDTGCTGAKAYICEKSANIGGRCTSPSGAAGEMLYNDDLNVMQFCNGSAWVAAQ